MPQLPVAAVALKNLDLVAVRILDEEELGEQAAIPMKFLHRRRLETELLEATLLRLDIIDREGDVAIPVAEIIGLRAAVIDGELELEIRLVVAQIEECEVVELEAKFWKILEEIARNEGIALTSFLATLHDEAQAIHGEVRNFASLLRCTCLVYLTEMRDVREKSPERRPRGGVAAIA